MPFLVDQQAPLYRRSWDATDATIVSESIDYWLAQGMVGLNIF